MDTTNDDFVTSLDVLRIINHLNRQANTESVDTAGDSVDVIADDVAQAVLAMNASEIDEDDDEESSDI